MADKIDFHEYKPLFNRRFDPDKMNILQDSLIARGVALPQRAAVLATALHESGGDENARSKDGRFNGLIQWSKERMPKDKTLKGQIHKLMEDLFTPEYKTNWTDGGGGEPFIMRGADGFNNFWNAGGPYQATMFFNKSYVRPAEEQARKNRAVEAGNIWEYHKSK